MQFLARASLVAAAAVAGITLAPSAVAFADPIPTIVIAKAPTNTPIVTAIAPTPLVADFSQAVARAKKAPQCAYWVSAQPIAILDVRATSPSMRVAITGDRHVNGIVVRHDGSFYSGCSAHAPNDRNAMIATVGPLSEGWAPGKYEIFAGAVSKQNAPVTLSVSVFDPDYVSPEDAAAAPTGPLELTLGDDVSKPVALKIQIPGSHPRTYPVTLKSTAKHRVVVLALGGNEHAGFSEHPNTPRRSDNLIYRTPLLDQRIVSKDNVDDNARVYVTPDKPITFDVTGDGGTTVYVVAADAHATIPDEHDVFGVPAADSKVRDRVLERYTMFLQLGGLTHAQFSLGSGTLSRDSAELAHRLFLTLDPAFFVFLDEAGACGPKDSAAGEPMLALQRDSVLRANGQILDCKAEHLALKRPTRVPMPNILVPGTDSNRVIWYDEDFLQLAATDKLIAAYKTAKATARACNDKMFAKLDPDGHADNYDVATIQNGKVTKIENAGDRNFRQVSAACNLDGLSKKRDAIYARLAKTFTAEEQKRLDEIAARFAAP